MQWEYTMTKARAGETLKEISRVARMKYAYFFAENTFIRHHHHEIY